ncbi:MAG: phosphonoacetaldehyde hydrolase [Kiritimatiellaeota bacterium]|nr:phosphonoacetaldehyde hydrolase [Kiritimatiellota bacterium]
MKNTIKTIILDWAGTTVDYGCFAPVDAFIAAFAHFGITPTMEETRAPMGMQKRAHIEQMLAGERLSAQWLAMHGRPPAPRDIDAIYAQFEPALFAVLSSHADPLPGVLDTVARIREMGIAIGSTTGYTRAMMDVVAPLAKSKGYSPDCLICPDDTDGIGRPHPYMLWRNLEKLGALSISETLKIGDTAADIQEGKNAGCVSVGVLKGSSMLGLNEAEFAALNPAEAQTIFDAARQNYINAGADFVIGSFAEIPQLIASINQNK